MKVKYILLLLLFFCNNSISTFAQDKIDCFAHFQLFKMQKSTLDEIRSFLNAENWEFDGAQSRQSFDYFSYSLDYDIVKWQKSGYSGRGGALILYNNPGKPNIIIFQAKDACFRELMKSLASAGSSRTKVVENTLITTFVQNSVTIEFREYKNENTDRQFSILVYNAAALDREIQEQKNKETAILKAKKDKEDSYNATMNKGDSLFSMRRFDMAKMQYEIAGQITPENTLFEEKIKSCNMELFKDLISEGDNQFNSSNYDKAIEFYKKAKVYEANGGTAVEKIVSAENKIREVKIISMLKQANNLFQQKDYTNALNAAREVLRLDPQNSNAQQLADQVTDLLDILNKRKTTVFSFGRVNTNDFVFVKNSLTDKLNGDIDKYKSGNASFSIIINFDTSGVNLSSSNIISSSIDDLEKYLNQIKNSHEIHPSKLGDFFVASTETVSVDVKWKSTRVSCMSKSKGIKFDNNQNENQYKFSNYINSQSFKHGKFVFEEKTKSENSVGYSDLSLISYKTKAGPLSCLYSFVLPGMGTLKTTYGKKGWGRCVGFFVSAGAAVACKLYSDELKRTAPFQATIDQTYTDAEYYQTLSYITGGFASAIYIYDIIYSFGKGIKNLKQTRYLKHQLKSGRVVIQKQPILIE